MLSEIIPGDEGPGQKKKLNKESSRESGEGENTTGLLETGSPQVYSLFNMPFSFTHYYFGPQEPEILKAPESPRVILERGGIPYIDGNVLEEAGEDLNGEFKKLVDAVIQKPSVS